MVTPHDTITCDLRSTSAHLAPLDSVVAALDSASCIWCLGLLRLLKSYLEAHGVPAFQDAEVGR